MELDPKIRQTPALGLIDQALVDAYSTPDARLIISMPPGRKGSRSASPAASPTGLVQNPDLRVEITSYEAGVARRPRHP